MSEWQPIETAPHDGSSILVCDKDETFYWPRIVEWADWKPGWWDGEHSYSINEFDFWQPLPERP